PGPADRAAAALSPAAAHLRRRSSRQQDSGAAVHVRRHPVVAPLFLDTHIGEVTSLRHRGTSRRLLNRGVRRARGVLSLKRILCGLSGLCGLTSASNGSTVFTTLQRSRATKRVENSSARDESVRRDPI